MPAMKFRIRGAKYDPTRKLPPSVQKVKTFLDRLKDGVLIETRDLAEETGTAYGSMRNVFAHRLFADYKENRGAKAGDIWGNKATIVELRFFFWYEIQRKNKVYTIEFDKLTDRELSKLRKIYGRTLSENDHK